MKKYLLFTIYYFYLFIGYAQKNEIPTSPSSVFSGTGIFAAGDRKLTIVHEGGDGALIRSTASYSAVDIDGINGDAALRFYKAGVGKWNIRNNPSVDDLEFFELDGGGQRMLLQRGTGKLGIGTSAPTAKLDVANSSSGDSDASLRLLHSTSNGFNRLNFENLGRTEKWIMSGNVGSGPADSRWNIYHTTTGNILSVTGDGKVGIGTTNPSKKVHISQGLSGATSFGNTMLFLEDNVNSYISMASPESIETGILFSKPSSTVSGGMVYNSANRLQLFAGGLARLHITSSGNVGIGTSSPTAKLDIEGDIVVKKSTNTSTGTINALSRNGGSSLFMNGVGTVTVNGIAGGVDGMILYLICGNSTSLVLAHENVSAAAADRITTQTAGNVTISFRGGAVLIYEGGTQKWRIIGFAN